jgi:hypothetical protein
MRNILGNIGMQMGALPCILLSRMGMQLWFATFSSPTGFGTSLITKIPKVRHCFLVMDQIASITNPPTVSAFRRNGICCSSQAV